MSTYEPGDQVVLTIGKKQLSKHRVPKHLRKLALEVLEVRAESVLVEDPEDPIHPVALSLDIIKPKPRSPGQIRAGDAEIKATAALRDFREVMRGCLSKSDFAYVEERIQGLSVIYSPRVQQMMLEQDMLKGWDPTDSD